MQVSHSQVGAKATERSGVVGANADNTPSYGSTAARGSLSLARAEPRESKAGVEDLAPSDASTLGAALLDRHGSDESAVSPPSAIRQRIDAFWGKRRLQSAIKRAETALEKADRMGSGDAKEAWDAQKEAESLAALAEYHRCQDFVEELKKQLGQFDAQ